MSQTPVPDPLKPADAKRVTEQRIREAATAPPPPRPPSQPYNPFRNIR